MRIIHRSKLRVLAHLSRDEKLIHAYEENQDIHARTASEVFGIPMDEVTSTHKERDAKRLTLESLWIKCVWFKSGS